MSNLKAVSHNIEIVESLDKMPMHTNIIADSVSGKLLINGDNTKQSIRGFIELTHNTLKLTIARIHDSKVTARECYNLTKDQHKFVEDLLLVKYF